MSAFLWMLFFATLLLALRTVLRGWARLRGFKLIFLPGVLVAMAARGLACVLARTPVTALRPPWRRGEPLAHGKPGIPVIGPLVHASVPFAAGTAAVLGLKALLGHSLAYPTVLGAVEPSGGVDALLGSCVDVAARARDFAAGSRLDGLSAAAFLYLAFSVLLYTAPTWREWKALAACLGACAALAAALDYLGIGPAFLSRGWFLQRRYGGAWQEPMTVLATAAALSLASGAGAVAVAWVLRHAVPRGGAGKSAERGESGERGKS